MIILYWKILVASTLQLFRNTVDMGSIVDVVLILAAVVAGVVFRRLVYSCVRGQRPW